MEKSLLDQIIGILVTIVTLGVNKLISRLKKPDTMRRLDVNGGSDRNGTPKGE